MKHLNRITQLLGFMAVTLSATAADDASPLWMRHPAVSPDGGAVAFTYGGQIWRVPSAGGEAVPLTSGDFFSTRPVWSPDGKALAFASKRHGNFDVFIMPAGGGEIRRLTQHSANDLPYAFTPDGGSIYFSSSRLGTPETVLAGAYAQSDQLYTVPAAGGHTRLLLPTPALDVAVSADGQRLLYDNRPMYENEWRKGGVSDGTRDIWLYDMAGKNHRKVTTNRGEDRDAFWAADGKSFYFLSEQGSSFNVWQQSLEDGAQPKQITKHQGQPVRFLSVAADGAMVYGFSGEIWRRAAGGGESKRVPIHISQGSLVAGTFSSSANAYASEIAVSPDGSEVAVVARGEVYVTHTTSGRTRRITSTPAFEQHVSFSPDGRALLYVSERTGDCDVFETSVPAGRAASFTAPGPLVEKKVIDTEGDALFPAYSPDGKRIAYLDNRTSIRVWERASGQTVTVLPAGTIYSYGDGDITFAWSPDGRWITATTGSIIGDMDIALLDSTGKQKALNISASGYADSGPIFTTDSRAIVWMSDRFGLRQSDASKSQNDLHIAHLTPEAYDEFQQARTGVVPATQPDAKNAAEKTEPWQPQAGGIRHRTTRLTPFSLSGEFFAKPLPDHQNLLLLLRDDDAGRLTGYRVGLQKQSFEQVFTRPLTTVTFAMDAKGENLFAISPAGLERISIANGSGTPIPFEARLDYDPRGEMAYLFQYFWRMTKLKFYEPTMHGRDWDALRTAYARYLPHLHEWEDFADVLGEMAGELNASHMAGAYLHQPPLSDSTASLGIYEDPSHEGEGVRVTEVLIGGPCDSAKSLVKPGAVILAIDGQSIAFAEQLHASLNRKADQPVELTVRSADGKSATQIVTPVSMDQARELASDHWVEKRKRLTAELSQGRLGYVYIAAMEVPNYQRTVDALLGEARDKEGVVIDIRYNRGGLLHDALATLFTGDVTAEFVTRDGVPVGKVPRDRWAKPSALLANASSYSDGSIFPHLYKNLRIGPLIGDRVPGTGTAVWWIYVLNGNLKYGIPQLGAKDLKTGWFENTETVPDILLYNDPDSIAAGRDPQLEAAVAELLKAKTK